MPPQSFQKTLCTAHSQGLATRSKEATSQGPVLESPTAEGKLTRAGCPQLAPAARPGLWVLQQGHSRRTLKVAPRYSLDKVKEMGTRAHLEQPVADGPAWPPPAHPLSQLVALSTQDTRRMRARAGGDSSAPAQTPVRRRGWASRARAGTPGRAVRRRPAGLSLRGRGEAQAQHTWGTGGDR